LEGVLTGLHKYILKVLGVAEAIQGGLSLRDLILGLQEAAEDEEEAGSKNGHQVQGDSMAMPWAAIVKVG
jgi:hypothetical protein